MSQIIRKTVANTSSEEKLGKKAATCKTDLLAIFAATKALFEADCLRYVCHVNSTTKLGYQIIKIIHADGGDS